MDLEFTFMLLMAYLGIISKISIFLLFGYHFIKEVFFDKDTEI